MKYCRCLAADTNPLLRRDHAAERFCCADYGEDARSEERRKRLARPLGKTSRARSLLVLRPRSRKSGKRIKDGGRGRGRFIWLRPRRAATQHRTVEHRKSNIELWTRNASPPAVNKNLLPVPRSDRILRELECFADFNFAGSAGFASG